MPLPANFQTVTIIGNYVDMLGISANGSIQFDMENEQLLYDSSADVIVVPKPIVASIAAGTFSVVLPATNDPDITPGFTYRVTESFPTLGITRTYSLTVPYNAEGSAGYNAGYNTGYNAQLNVESLNLADIAPF